MRFFQKTFLILSIMIAFTSCNFNEKENTEHFSQEEVIKYVEKNIEEETEFIKVDTQDPLIYVYTFNLPDRNIDFEVIDYITNNGFNLDGTYFWNLYRPQINIRDYFDSIVENAEQEKLNILNKYDNIDEILTNSWNDNATAREPYVLSIKNYNDLPNLSKYFVETDKLYHFNIKDQLYFKYIYCPYASNLMLRYSTNENKRLTYDTAYSLLEEEYVKENKKKSSYPDYSIPEDVWDKY